MLIQGVQLGATLLVLGILVLLARQRERMAAEDHIGFQNIVLGIGLLGLVTVAFLAESTGALRMIPFLADPVFFRLTITITAITGVILLSGGISTWLPISRAARETNRTRISRLELIRKLEQLINTEPRPDAMLEKALSHMVMQTELNAGAVYRIDPHTLATSLLSLRSNREEPAPDPSNITIQISSRDLAPSSAWNDISVETSEGAPGPDLVLPLILDERPAALFLLWGPSGGLGSDDRLLLLLARDIIARALQTRSLQDQTEYCDRLNHLIQRLASLFADNGTLTESFLELNRLVKETFPSDLMVLTLAYGEYDIRRFTLGQTDTLLTEKTLSRDVLSPALGITADSGRPVVISDLDKLLDPIMTTVLRTGQFTQALIIPASGSGTPLGHLLLAAKSAKPFLDRHLQAAAAIQPLLSGLIFAEIERFRQMQRARRLAAIENLASHCAGQKCDIDSLFAEAAHLLRKETGAAVVRIALFEDNGTFIRSRALSSAHPIANAVPSNGYLIQSLMPLHSRVRKTGESLHIDATDGSVTMSPAEAQQIYQSDLATALLHPLGVDHGPIGIISLADRRGPHRFRFSDDHRSFVRGIAAVLSLATRLHETPWGALEYRDKTSADLENQDRELRGHIRSSLTGILGSVEMLKARSTGADLDRYVRIIDRSARRIEQYFKTDEPVC